MATVTEPKTKKTAKKTDSIAVGFCLDETGSMGRCWQSTIDGFNEFIGDTKKQQGKTRLSLTKFSDQGSGSPIFRPVYEAVDIKDVGDLNQESYVPSGNTPLFDAIGYTIKKLESWLSEQKEKWAVLFVIQTDGIENASREYTREKIFELIRRKENDDGWRFIYLGVDQDEYAAQQHAGAMGMSVGSSYGYNRGETRTATASVGHTVAAFRGSGGTMSSADLSNQTRAETEKRLKKEKPKAPPPVAEKKEGKRDTSKPNF